MRAHDDHRDGPPVSGPTPTPPDERRALLVALVWLRAALLPLYLAVSLDGYSERNIRRAHRGSVAGWIVGILLILAILIILAVEVSRFFPFGFSLP